MNIKNIGWFLCLALVYAGLLACNAESQKNGEIPAEVNADGGKPAMSKAHAVTLSSNYEISKAWALGHFKPEDRTDFVLIDTVYADRGGLYLHKDTYAAFRKMWAAARKDNVKLIIRSATRNHSYQRGIWERKWTGKTLLEGKTNAQLEIPDPVERAKAILRYSSMPGSSRHHWGTDIDFNAFENEYFEPGGAGENLYKWLVAHAADYGFCQVYSDKQKDSRTGYEMEKWHWSYMPLAWHLDQYIDQNIQDKDVVGFEGFEHAHEVGIVKNYMQGIDASCAHID